MKLVKSLLLGSAAGLAAFTGAQAADLPVKAKPVEYVKICSLYGAGFYYIPGTDTCIRIGGQIRAEAYFNSRGTNAPAWGITDGTATGTRDRDYFTTRSRVYLNMDTRTQTAYGTLRTFSVVRAELQTPVGTSSAAGAINIDTGIIQWGGFTIGRAATSYLENPWTYAAKWGSYGWFGNPDTSGTGRFVLAYTHQFGNGISASLSLEDSKERKRGNYNGALPLTAWGATLGTDTRGGNTWPDVVAQLRIEQAWGGFHIAGGITNNHVAYSCGASGATCTEITGPTPSDKIGGSVNAALKFNVPTGVNDALYIGGSYSVGATTSVFAGAGPNFGVYGNSNLFYGSIAGGYLFDSVYDTRTGTGQQLTTAYGGAVAFEHGWNPEWRTSVFGGAQFVDYNATANAILCSKFTAATLSNANTTCNMDMRIVGAGTRTYWTPVRDLTIGVEFLWQQIHSGNEGAAMALPAQGYKPAAVYEVKDQNVFSGMFAVRRFF
ncbi:polymerase [Afipia sp. P52-10]|jgi:hypothetical protein|uniref:porin n=1 Tax=Afipia sp. P52-10 TaxID=1429916 RepID=UPI0003DF1657|nr:porin [Afipia sp. P52-10]ETR76155.1 polymerase [Afipia sp. P52-10]